MRSNSKLKPKGKSRRNLYLDDDAYAIACALATAEGRSVSGFVNAWLKKLGGKAA